MLLDSRLVPETIVRPRSFVGLMSVYESNFLRLKHLVPDLDATTKRRQQIREERKERAIPFKEWWTGERKKVAAQENMDNAVRVMWETSMRLSPEYGDNIRKFWALPEDFTFTPDAD